MTSRVLLGILTIGLLVAGIAMQFTPGWQGTAQAYAGNFIRAGLVLGALWLALPQLTAFFQKTPRWLLIGGAIGVAIAAMNWTLLIVIVPVVAALWFFAPRVLASTKAKIMPAISAPPPGRRARRKREAE